MQPKEIQQLDRILTGQEAFNFGHFGTGTDDRKYSPYTWGDAFMNMNDAPFNTDTAIFVTAWAGQLGWLKQTLTSYRNTGAYVILSFDNYSYAWEQLDSYEVIAQKLPRPIHTLLTHSYVMKHKTYDADKRIGWFWNVKYALAIANAFPNIKYVYCTNGDCIFERPEGLGEIKEMLRESGCDFISGQSEANSTIHTACVLYKKDALNQIVDYMTSRISPMVIGGQSPEGMLRDCVNKFQMKELFAPVQPRQADGAIDWYCTLNADSTWKSTLGFRNLYAEQEYRTNNRLELLNPKYMDRWKDWIYFNPAERSMMCKYYDTMDRRWLYMWWDRNCNSCEERVYHPLEHYGTEPIPEDGKNWA